MYLVFTVVVAAVIQLGIYIVDYTAGLAAAAVVRAS